MLNNVKLALKQIADAKGKSLYKLAKETETSYSTIHKMATKDVQSVDLEILRKLCISLDCKPNDIIVLGN